VRFAGVSHPGLIGTAPSAELLATWNKREGELIAQHPNAVPAVAFAPNAVGAYVGQDLDDKVRQKIAEEGARTIPGREHGGNCDVCPYIDKGDAPLTSCGRLRTCREGLAVTSPSSSRAQICLSEIFTFLKEM
jgi:hypothetical protein